MRVLDWLGCQVPADRRPAQGAAAARRPSCIIATGADSRNGLRMVKPHPEEALIRRVWLETAVHQWNARKTPGPLSIDVPSPMKASAPPGKPAHLPRSLIFEERLSTLRGKAVKEIVCEASSSRRIGKGRGSEAALSIPLSDSSKAAGESEVRGLLWAGRSSPAQGLPAWLVQAG